MTNTFVEMARQTHISKDILDGALFIKNIAKTISMCADKESKDTVYKTAENIARQYEKELRANQYKMCHVSVYGACGGGSIIKKENDVVLYGAVQYYD